jgi:hypothetical protein
MRLWSRKPKPARPREEVLAELEALTAQARERPDPKLAARLIELRHEAGIALLDEPTATDPAHPEPAFDALPEAALPEVDAAHVTPELVRAAFLRSGCLLVRGFLGADDVERLKHDIDRAYEARENESGGRSAPQFHRFRENPRFDLRWDRSVVDKKGWGGLWIADAPDAALTMFDAFDRSGITALAEGYLGEKPAISVNKSLLRVVQPPTADDLGPQLSAWHQDGAFLGDVRALNVWVSLSRCGDVAPGMDLVPRRIEKIVPTGTEGAVFDWSVSQTVAEEAAGDAGIVRPIFEPGDVLLFDELFLHATAAKVGMTQPRYAVECWFFGPSSFPENYAPLAA